MILLVDHDLRRLLAVDDHGAPGVLGGLLAGDEVALDQHLLFQRGKLLHVLGERILHLRQVVHAAA